MINRKHINFNFNKVKKFDFNSTLNNIEEDNLLSNDEIQNNSKNDLYNLYQFIKYFLNQIRSKYIEGFKLGKINITGTFDTNEGETIDLIDNSEKKNQTRGTSAGMYIELAEYLTLKKLFHIKHEPNGGNTFPDFVIDDEFNGHVLNIDSKASKSIRSQNSLGVYSKKDFKNNIEKIFGISNNNTSLKEFYSFIAYFKYNEFNDGKNIQVNQVVLAPTIQLFQILQKDPTEFATKKDVNLQNYLRLKSNLNYNGSFYEIFKELLILYKKQVQITENEDSANIKYNKCLDILNQLLDTNPEINDKLDPIIKNNNSDEEIDEDNFLDLDLDLDDDKKQELEKFLKRINKKNKIKSDLKENFKLNFKNLLLTEGGNAIKNSEHIRGDYAMKVANLIISKVQKYFDCDMSVLGSTGKKGEDAYSGDIDIALTLSIDREDELKEYLEKIFPGIETRFMPGLKILSVGFKYIDFNNNEKIVQVDFMFVNNLDYAKFMYHSPNFIKNESNFKGLFRTNLLGIIASRCPINEKYLPTEYFTNEYDGKYKGEIKSFWKYSLSYDDGLRIIHKSFVGKNNKLKNAITIKEDTIKVTQDIDKILHIILGPEATINDCNSFENLVNFLTSNKYIYSNDEQLNLIFDDFLNDSRHQDPEIKKQLEEYINFKMKNKKETK